MIITIDIPLVHYRLLDIGLTRPVERQEETIMNKRVFFV